MRAQSFARMSRSRRVRSAALVAFAILLSSGCWSPGDRREVAAENLYDRHCSYCHGLASSGPTPVTGLGFEVADLRRLSERYGTPLDDDRLAAYIDGRHVTPGEDRAPQMPVWGEELYSHLPDDAALEELRAGAINLLVEYLQSIQVAGG